MARSEAAKLKSEVRGQLKAGWSVRGWSVAKDDALTFVAPEVMTSVPLIFRWLVQLESGKYGGVNLSGSGAVCSTEVVSFLQQLPGAALPPDFDPPPFGPADFEAFNAASTTARALLAPESQVPLRWEIEGSESLDTSLSEYWQMVDGPLSAWIADRSTVGKLLDACDRGLIKTADDNVRVRSMSVLALQGGRPELASKILAGYQPQGGDTPERLEAFKAILADRF